MDVYSSIHSVQHSTHVRGGLGKPAAMPVQCAAKIVPLQRTWIHGHNGDIFSSATMSNFTSKDHYDFFTVLLPFHIQHPSSGEEFKAMQTLVVFHLLERNKTSCVPRIYDGIWVAAG